MKIEILQHILEVTKLQTSSLQVEDIEQYSALLEVRQKDIDKLEEINQGNPKVNSSEEEALLKEIIALNTVNNQEFHRQFEEVQQNLRKIRSQKRVDTVYSNPYDISQEEGIFFDKR